MLSRTLAGSVLGIEGHIIRVEADQNRGLPGMTIVGLPDAAIKESRERVRAAIRNSGFEYPMRRITINLAPAVMRKTGGVFDLAIACAILLGSDQIAAESLEGVVLCGELGLDGSLQPVSGILPLAADLQRLGYRRLIVPEANGAEAGLVPDLDIRKADSLASVVAHLNDFSRLDRVPPTPRENIPTHIGPDMSDVRGQLVARRALEIAAAGNHNLVLVGPPGSGKSMLASRLPSIMPPLRFEEALEVTRIHSVAGHLTPSNPWVSSRPFRSPHHTASDVSLIGGGRIPRPGEASLAHRGVLFLDEMLEFKRGALEVLRQPLVDGTVTISRAQAVLSYPARFTLVGTFNPCPCGYLGDEERHCICTPLSVQRYRSRLSGPLLDRIDLQVEVPRVSLAEVSAEKPGEASEVVRQRVIQARRKQFERLGASSQLAGSPGAEFTNGEMSPSDLRRTCQLLPKIRQFLDRHAHNARLTARAYEKVVKVARTVADLDNSETIQEQHIAEAISYRALDLTEQKAA